jgi:hypothetical protein
MRRGFLDPLGLALPIALGLTVTLAVIGFGTGPGWVRPLCCFMIGLTASLAVAEYRSTRPAIALTPAGVAMAMLDEAGLLLADIAAVDVTPCPQGDVVTVHCLGGGSGRFFVDPVARVHAMPELCPTAALFVERYPSVEARALFAVAAGVGR